MDHYRVQNSPLHFYSTSWAKTGKKYSLNLTRPVFNGRVLVVTNKNFIFVYKIFLLFVFF